MSSNPPPIPILLLKTRSQPNDTYEEYFSPNNNPRDVHFQPHFIPVLEHAQNEDALSNLGWLLSEGKLKEQYGGMIFTSQRAVEAWSSVALKVERESQSAKDEQRLSDPDLNSSQLPSSSLPILQTSSNRTPAQDRNTAIDTRTGEPFQTDILTTTPFPLYVVGPATGRALEDLLSTLSTPSQPSTSPNPPSQHHSPFLILNPSIHGTHTGSGALLAPFILAHYNTLHAHNLFKYHDAPRLPFIPLLGMGSENYSRRRLERDDPRLHKKPLLFLVGEVRRDVIPKTLMDERRMESGESIGVEEVEVYSTVVRKGFRADFEELIRREEQPYQLQQQGQGVRLGSNGLSASRSMPPAVIVIVVFSPQGSGDMLKALGYIDESTEQVTPKARTRWSATSITNTDSETSTPHLPRSSDETETETNYIIATIGPTTRDYLINTFGFEPDVCANKPSPEGIYDGVQRFVEDKGLFTT